MGKQGGPFMNRDQQSQSNLYSFLISLFAFSLAFNLFSYVTADPDLWGHVKFGEQIWTAKALHTDDPFSYTAHGMPWINHEWLSEIIFYLTFRFSGPAGLLLLIILAGLLTVSLLFQMCLKKENNLPALFLYFPLLVSVMGPGYMMRPHIFSYLFLAILMCLLQSFFHDGNRRAMTVIPLIFLFWVNMHGGVVAGLGIFALVILTESIRCIFQGEKLNTWLWAGFSLSCLTILINPYGVDLWKFFYHTLSVPREIGEWNPVPLLNADFLAYKTLTLLFLATLFAKTKKRSWEVVIILFSLWYGFKHQRHTVLTAIVMTPYLYLHLSAWIKKTGGSLDLSRSNPAGKFVKRHFASLFPISNPALTFTLRVEPGPRSSPFHGVLKTALVALILLNIFEGVEKYRSSGAGIIVEPQVYPSYAVQFMNVNHIAGNILVPFDWGEYVIWKMPGSRVSIDGRFRTVYPKTIIRQNRAFSFGGPDWQGMLNRYPTEIILTRRSDKTHQRMDEETGWMKIYEDPVSLIYMRVPGKENSGLVRKRGEFIHPEDPPSYLFP